MTTVYAEPGTRTRFRLVTLALTQITEVPETHD